MGYNAGTHYGNTQWINLDPCGLFCGCMTYFLLAFGTYATSKFVIIPWMGYSPLGLLNLVLFNIFTILGAYSHFKAMTTDPGAVPKDAKPLLSDTQEHDLESNDRPEPFKKFCKRCKAFKPARAHHCSLCGRCVVKMDHHCPWVNNCVGIGNHKLFLQFLFWVFTTCIYSMLLVIAKYVSCIYGYSPCSVKVDEHLMVIFLMVESVLFGLFTLCMLGDQATTIMSNQTQIDRLKNTKYEYQNEINEVFGSPSSVCCSHTWLYPVAVKFPNTQIKAVILGYVLSNDPDSAGEEMVPLIHTDHSPLLSDGAAGGSNGKSITSKLAKNRKLYRHNSHGADGHYNSDESNYGAEEESISEWLNDNTHSTAAAVSSSSAEYNKYSNDLLATAMGGGGNSAVSTNGALAPVTEERTFEAQSDAEDQAKGLLAAAGGTLSTANGAATSAININTTVRKRQ